MTEQYDIENSLPILMATCVKLMREALNTLFSQAGQTVTTEQWAVLVHLWHREGLSQQEIATQSARSKVAAFKIVEKLESQGLVRREPDPRDARCKRVFLTPQGRELTSELIPLAKQNIARMCGDVPEQDLNLMKVTLRRLIANLTE